MQQNQHCSCPPEVFWTNNRVICTAGYAPSGLPHHETVVGSPQGIGPPLPVPARKSHGQNARDGVRLCFLVVFLLTFLALTGIGLAMFQIFHLQQELNALKEVSGSEHALRSERLKGFLNGTTGEMTKRRAHLTGKENQKSLPLEWESTYGHAFISGMRYKNRCLVIEEAGLYFVYSKVFFRGEVCTNQPLDHVILKRNPAYPDSQVLMEDRKMNYCKSTHMWGKSSYLGALFNLSRHDSVCVNVSKATLVNPEESKTFFGLFML